MEEKGLRINAGMTKIMSCDCGTGLDLLQASFHVPSVTLEWVATASSAMAARNAVGSSTSQRTLITGNCMPHWWQPIEGSPSRRDKLEVVASFCYLGDSSQQVMAVNFQPQHMWKPPGRSSRSCYQFSLPITSLSRDVAMCTALVCGAQCSMPVGLGQNWTSNVCSGTTGQWSDRFAMASRKTLSPSGPMSYLCSLALRSWTLLVWTLERSNGAVKSACDIQVDVKRGPGRCKMTWEQLTERDRREWKLSAVDPHDRHSWRSGVKSAMRAASQLPVRGPTDVDIAPVP